MVHWHVIVYIMFVYCTYMNACMQKKKRNKKKFEEKEFLNLLLITLLHYSYMII